MIKSLNHVAIAVPNLQAAIERYRSGLGAIVSDPTDLPDHGVRIAFVELENTKIELMEPMDSRSPIAGFLASNPDGAIHHLCFEVEDIDCAGRQVTESGMRLLAGRRLVRIHPKERIHHLLLRGGGYRLRRKASHGIRNAATCRLVRKHRKTLIPAIGAHV